MKQEVLAPKLGKTFQTSQPSVKKSEKRKNPNSNSKKDKKPKEKKTKTDKVDKKKSGKGETPTPTAGSKRLTTVKLQELEQFKQKMAQVRVF